MHVKAKRVAFLGLSMALSVVLVILSGVIESNTLFLLALASFFTGIALGEYGLVEGAGYMVGSVFLSFLLAPNKLYVLTYAGISFYLVAMEFVWRKIVKGQDTRGSKVILTVSKLLAFNAMYIPLLLFVPKLFVAGTISKELFVVLLIAGQAALFLYDYAYHYFMNRYWLKFSQLINK